MKFSDRFTDSNNITLYRITIESENGEVMEFDGVNDTYAQQVYYKLLRQASEDERVPEGFLDRAPKIKFPKNDIRAVKGLRQLPGAPTRLK